MLQRVTQSHIQYRFHVVGNSSGATRAL